MSILPEETKLTGVAKQQSHVLLECWQGGCSSFVHDNGMGLAHQSRYVVGEAGRGQVDQVREGGEFGAA